MDKSEIIAQTLRNQADLADKTAKSHRHNALEVDGARQALYLFYKEVISLQERLEVELLEPAIVEKMSSDSDLLTARNWVRRYIARISTMAMEASKHQERLKQNALGKVEQSEAFRDSLMKAADIEVAKAARRLEVEAELRLKEEARKAQESEQPAEKVEKNKPSRKPRKRKTKKEE